MADRPPALVISWEDGLKFRFLGPIPKLIESASLGTGCENVHFGYNSGYFLGIQEFEHNLSPSPASYIYILVNLKCHCLNLKNTSKNISLADKSGS